MAWDYRPPSKFDAKVSTILSGVVIAEGRELNYYLPTEADCRKLAHDFRRFRWCVRADPAQAGNYYDFEMAYDYRTKVMFHPQSGWYLRIRAIPNRLGYLTELNPWISVLASQ
jgi:hypothetical protein